MSAQVIIAARCGPDPKSRLAQVLGVEDRGRLVQMMLRDMLGALRSRLRALVVTPDSELADVAREMGARAILQIEPGLNGAFAQGLALASTEAPVALLPGDLPLLSADELEASMAHLAAHQVVLAQALADGGTGAVVLRAGLAWEPMFGRDSFARHSKQARARGLSLTIVRAPSLGLDIDRPEDIAAILEAGPHTRTAVFLAGKVSPEGR